MDKLGDEFTLPTGDQTNSYLTFTMTPEQQEFIKTELDSVKKDMEKPTGHETANGNALYHVVKEWSAQKI
jgi:hypothetical protein